MTDTTLPKHVIETDDGLLCYLPRGFIAAPTTPVEVLEQAKAVLVEEDRWVEGHWFQNTNPTLNPQDPFCNSWTVCAQGAVGIVTYGMTATGRSAEPWEFDNGGAGYNRLYDQANELLVEAANDLLRETAECDCDCEPDHVHDSSQCCDNCCDVETEHSEGCITVSGEVSEVPDYNDGHCKTRDDAIAWFDLGIEIGKRKEAARA